MAAREGVDPLQLEEPLYDAVDIGALETIVASTSGGDGGALEIAFTYYGYEVVVDETGEVTVTQSGTASGPGGDSANRSAPGK